VVPRLGCESIENVPFTSFSRSSMLIEAKPSGRPCPFAIKARARIANREMNLTQRSPQSHFELAYPTVFGRIVEGFLQNSEEAKGNGRRQRLGKSWVSKSISTVCCSPNSLQKPLMAATSPNIPVLTSATRATKIGYRSLSRRSASVVRPHRSGLQQASRRRFVGGVLVY